MGCKVEKHFNLQTQDQHRIPIPIAINVPKVPPLCIMVFPTPPMSSRPLIPILKQENVPNRAPAAMPTANPIINPIFTLSKQLGCACPWGPTATGISADSRSLLPFLPRPPHRNDVQSPPLPEVTFSCRTELVICWRRPHSYRSRGVVAVSLVMLFGVVLRKLLVASGSCRTGCAVRALHGDEKERSRQKVPEESELRPLYLDVQATTPLDPRVLDCMLPYLVNYYGNPHSRTHAYGWETEKAVEKARQQVACLIGADPREIIFTSGATESNNISLKGVARFYKSRKKHIITTQTEHKCVLDSCRSLEGEGFQVTYLPVKSNGLVDLKVLEDAIRPDTSLVSVMAVNNEIGVKQPIQDIGYICSSRKIFFHTDAAQAVGKIPLNVNEMKIDLMSISGHKIYGPKGIGAIYVRRRPRVRVEALLSGGGQERGLRSGTVPAPLTVGFGAASEIAQEEMQYDHRRISYLAEKLINNILKQIPQVVLNGDPDHRYPGCVNLSFAYVEGESLLMALKDVALSSGSACTSASLEPSYVLRAIGADEDLAHSSIRFGIGRFTTEEEIDYTINKCVSEVSRLREMSPLWEMVQDGIDLKSIQWTQH